MSSIRAQAEMIAEGWSHDQYQTISLIYAIEQALRDERERAAKIAETDRFAPTDHGGLCLECNEWAPPRHPERGEHKESCSWSWVHGKEFKGDACIAAAIRKED